MTSRRDIHRRHPGESYVEGMFAQLDTGTSYRPPMTRPIMIPSPGPPLTANDYEEFATTVQRQPPPPEPKPQTPARESLLALVSPEQWAAMTRVEVARLCRCPVHAVQRYAAEHNISAKGKWTKDYRKILDSITPWQWASLTYAQIAAIVGCSAGCVFQYRQRNALPKREREKKAKVKSTRKPGRARTDLSMIGEREWEVLRDHEIAQRVGCSVSTVYNARRNRIKTP